MKKIIRIVSTQESNVLQVRFWPTDICNFDCSYCFPGSHDNKFRFPADTNLALNSFRKIFDFYKAQGKTKFHLMIGGGGEPTLWPDLNIFCRQIRESYDVHITLITNGSRTIRWWEEHLQSFDDVVLSCHNEYVDIEHQKTVGDLLFASGVKVTALMLMDEKHWDKCVSYVELMKMSKYPWTIEAKPIVDALGHGMDCYSEEQIAYITTKRIPNSEWIFKHFADIKMYESVSLFDDGTATVNRSPEIITNKHNYFYNWSCNVGKESISIDVAGNVLGSCQVPVFDQPVNIFKELPTLALNDITCPKLYCSCQPDTHITKAKVL
jgi:sulfatase maturation enzyme AslB (radical SAM superfamily)